MPSSAEIKPACRQCGSVLKAGREFCTKCGAPTEPNSAPYAGKPEDGSAGGQKPSFDSMPLPPPASGGMEFVLEGIVGRSGFSPTSDAGQSFTPSGRESSPPDYSLSIQGKLKKAAAKATNASAKAGLKIQTDSGGMIQRMIRAARLDKTIFQEVAEDYSLQTEAWKAIFLIMGLSSLSLLFDSIRYLSATTAYSFIISTIIQVLAFMAQIWVIQRVAAAWLKLQIEFPRLFRALVYAQTPSVLTVLPLVGQLMWVWRLATGFVAIRNLTGASAKNAAILALIGLLVAAMGALIAGPLVDRLLYVF
jgi:hypothetical protein